MARLGHHQRKQPDDPRHARLFGEGVNRAGEVGLSLLARRVSKRISHRVGSAGRMACR